MQALVIVVARVLGHGDEIERAVRSGAAIDDRRRGDAEFRRDLCAAAGIAQGLARPKQRHVPENGAGVGVEGVDRVVLGGREQHVVLRSGHAEPGYIQRLGIDLAVYRQISQQAEARRSHIRQSQLRLRGVLAAAAQIIFVREHIGSRRHGPRRDGQHRAAAGGAAARIGDDDGESTAAIAGRRGTRRITRRLGAGDRGSASLPLIAQGCSTGCGHREGGGLAHRHTLIRRLYGDRGIGGGGRGWGRSGRAFVPAAARSGQNGQG